MTYPSDDLTFREFQCFMDSIQHHWPQTTNNLAFRAIELAGETGEVVEKCKKVIRDRNSQPTVEDLDAIGKEIGDVVISANNLCTLLGLDFGAVMEQAKRKMEARVATKTTLGSGDDREVTR